MLKRYKLPDINSGYALYGMVIIINFAYLKVAKSKS